MLKKVFKWLPEYSVHVALIDAQHKRFVTLMNKVFTVTTSMAATEEQFMKVLGELSDHGKFHFATEEKYFDEFHYEYAEEHKAQHTQILEYLSNFNIGKKETFHEAGTKLLMFLEVWLVDHLAYWDKKYSQCFNEHGLV